MCLYLKDNPCTVDGFVVSLGATSFTVYEPRWGLQKLIYVDKCGATGYGQGGVLRASSPHRGVVNKCFVYAAFSMKTLALCAWCSVCQTRPPLRRKWRCA